MGHWNQLSRFGLGKDALPPVIDAAVCLGYTGNLMAKSGPKKGDGFEREADWGGMLAGLRRDGWTWDLTAARRTALRSRSAPPGHGLGGSGGGFLPAWSP